MCNVLTGRLLLEKIIKRELQKVLLLILLQNFNVAA